MLLFTWLFFTNTCCIWLVANQISHLPQSLFSCISISVYLFVFLFQEIIRILLTMNGRGRDRRIRDRISALNDELISRILSFLPIKDAVATSTLSTRWRNVWTLAPNIEIDDYSLGNINHDQFYTIVGKLLSHPMSPPHELSKIKMEFCDHTSPAEITTLIRASLKRIVKELDLSICPDDEGNSDEVNFQLPVEVFTNQHLQVLKLSKVKVVVPPDSRPSFKVLHVDISYYCDKSLQDFYRNCPALEDLTLEGELNEFPDEERNFDVSSESLKDLRIKLQSSFDFEHGNGNLDTYGFIINAPNLKTLIIDEDILGTYKMEDMPSLVEAKIQVGWEDLNYPELDADRVFLARAFTIMAGLTHVRSLTLGERTVGALGYAVHLNYLDDQGDGVLIWHEAEIWRICGQTFHEFHHLTNLKMSIGNSHGWNLLPYLLRFFPKLEMLCLEMVYAHDVDPNDRFEWNPPQEKPKCLMETIIRVEIKGFHQADGEGLPLINYMEQISTEIREFQIIIG